MEKKSVQSGFTVVETIMTIFIFSVIMLGTSLMLRDILENSRQQYMVIDNVDQARRVANTFVKELRNATYGANGAYSVNEASNNQIIFFSTAIKGDGTISKVRYYVSNNILYKGVTNPAGNPPSYTGLPETVTTLLKISLPTNPVAVLLASGGSTNAAQSNFTTASITPSANKLILLAVEYYTDNANATITSVTGNGLTWVPVANTFNYLGYNRLALFRALSASPTAGPVTINFSASNVYTVAFAINEFGNVNISGVNGSGAIVQSATNSTDGNVRLTVTLGAFSGSSNATFGAFGSARAVTPGSGFTELSDYTAVGWNRDSNVQTQWRNDNDMSVDVELGYQFANGIASEIKFSNDANPLFYYHDGNYNGSGNPLSQPVNLNQVKFIKINLNILKQLTATSNSTFTVSAGASIRNLKNNLGN